MSKKTIISEIENRDAFVNLLKHNTGLIVLKLGVFMIKIYKNFGGKYDNLFCISKSKSFMFGNFFV